MLDRTLRHNLLFQARYCDERCQRADWGRHGDYCVKVQQKIRKKIEEKKAEKETGWDACSVFKVDRNWLSWVPAAQNLVLPLTFLNTSRPSSTILPPTSILPCCLFFCYVQRYRNVCKYTDICYCLLNMSLYINPKRWKLSQSDMNEMPRKRLSAPPNSAIREVNG